MTIIGWNVVSSDASSAGQLTGVQVLRQCTASLAGVGLIYFLKRSQHTWSTAIAEHWQILVQIILLANIALSCASYLLRFWPPRAVKGKTERKPATSSTAAASAGRKASARPRPIAPVQGSDASGHAGRQCISPYSSTAPSTSSTSFQRRHLEMQRDLQLTFPPPAAAAQPADASPLMTDLGPAGTPADVTPFLTPPTGDEDVLTVITNQQLPPKYHFSLSWAASALGAAVNAFGTSARQSEALLRMLQIDRNTLSFWGERLRVWSTEEVLRPLLQRAFTSSRRASRALQALPVGFDIRPLERAALASDALRLPGEDELAALDAALRAYGRQVAAKAASGTAPGQLTLGFSSTQHQEAQQAQMQVKATQLALKAVDDYHSICKLLRGEYPNKPGMLGGSRPAYLLSRVQQLASDSCCKTFKWNGGGTAEGGLPWNHSLPTDTQVVLYLIGAFCVAPFWIFGDTQSPAALQGEGGPFCLGNSPPGKEPFMGILTGTVRSEVAQRMQAGLVLEAPAGSEEQQLVLNLNSRGFKSSVVLCREWSFFEKVALFLAYVQFQLDAKIGQFDMQHLKLTSVLETPSLLDRSKW